MIMAVNTVAIDTNVLIYVYDSSDVLKRQLAIELLSDNPHVPAQVISECLNTLRRLLPIAKEKLLILTADLFADCPIIPIHVSTLREASLLVKKYEFQLFDAVIVAASLEAGCNILYSEDMHHDLLVNNSLRIINPFV